MHRVRLLVKASVLTAVGIAGARTGGRATRAQGFGGDAFVTVELPAAEDWYEPVHDWFREDENTLRAGRPLPYGALLHFAWLEPGEADDYDAAAHEINAERMRRLGID